MRIGFPAGRAVYRKNLIRYNIFPDGKSDLLSFPPALSSRAAENPLPVVVYTPRGEVSLWFRTGREGHVKKKPFLPLTFYSETQIDSQQRTQ